MQKYLLSLPCANEILCLTNSLVILPVITMPLLEQTVWYEYLFSTIIVVLKTAEFEKLQSNGVNIQLCKYFTIPFQMRLYRTYGTPWLSDAKTKTYGMVLYTYVVLKHRSFLLKHYYFLRDTHYVVCQLHFALYELCDVMHQLHYVLCKLYYMMCKLFI